jgi:hypothetical protein
VNCGGERVEKALVGVGHKVILQVRGAVIAAEFQDPNGLPGAVYIERKVV